MGKRLPQLYYIKMKISYDVGFIAVGFRPWQCNDIIRFFIYLSLRSKRFLARFRLESWEKSKKNMNDGGGGGERRNRLPTNPTILKNCVRPRTQLLIGAVRVVLIT